jgi:hypothetical protein
VLDLGLEDLFHDFGITRISRVAPKREEKDIA